jgi:putative NADH-flavin reductase
MAQKYAKDQPSGFDNHVKNVAVVGVSGSVGEYITKHLLSTGKHTVTAITREGSKSEIPSGVKVAKVNYDQSETLVEALSTSSL